MFYLKLSLTGLLAVTFYGLVACSDDKINTQLTSRENNEQLNKPVEELMKNGTNTRTGRVLLQHKKKAAFTARRMQPMQGRARADHLALRTQIRRTQNSVANGQGMQQNKRYGLESLKSSKYVPSSKGTNLIFSSTAKVSPYRAQYLGGYQNSIHIPSLTQQYVHNFKASPTFNGQVVVHPVSQPQQKKQETVTQKDTSYPKYIKPPQQQTATALASQQLQPQQQQNPSLAKYSDFKQYAIPDHKKMQKHNEQHEKYLQQQKFLTAKNPLAYYQLQHSSYQKQDLSAQPQKVYSGQQPVQYFTHPQSQHPTIPIHESTKTNSVNTAFPTAPSQPPKMYSVYEETDMSELPTNSYQGAINQAQHKEAQEYLRFMNTDEYFLPKKDPNYKRIDDEADKRQYNVLKTQTQQHLHSLQESQAPSSLFHQPKIQQIAYQQKIYTPSPASTTLHSDAAEATSYNPGKHISRYFYEQEPSASASDSISSSVLTSKYQTAYNQNQFAVHPQDNRVGKFAIPESSTSTSIVMSTQSPIAYPPLKYNTASSRTPEPLRFEFTERDAMVGSFSYTNSPQKEFRYNEFTSTSNGMQPVVRSVESSTVSSLKTQHYLLGKNALMPIMENDGDDPEDGDDIQTVGNNILGRQPMVSSNLKASKVSSTTEAPPSEQQDTEQYCERICAIVEDENEEIVCGSDGYMYTSEAQMECYASCLHIDITIQGKGSCSRR